jgi:FtsZ-binding cell division protein ZapB
LSADLSKNNLIDPETIIEIVTATGLTKMKEDVKSSLEKKRREADTVNKLQQQAEELSGQLKQVTQEAQQLQQQVKALNEAKLQLEKERLAFSKELEWYKARGESSYKTSMLELEKKRIELEGLQLIDNNPNNDEIKNE